MQVKQEVQSQPEEEEEEVICIKEEPEEEVMATLLLDCQMEHRCPPESQVRSGLGWSISTDSIKITSTLVNFCKGIYKSNLLEQFLDQVYSLLTLNFSHPFRSLSPQKLTFVPQTIRFLGLISCRTRSWF